MKRLFDSRPVAVVSVHACPFSEVGRAENGGMSVYIREVAHSMSRRGIETHIFTRKDDPGAPPELDLPDGCRLIHIEAGPKKGLLYLFERTTWKTSPDSM